MYILFSNEELQILEKLETIEVDPITIIVHLSMRFGANYDRMPMSTEQKIEQESPELADEFAGALIVPDSAVKTEVREVE